MPFKSKAQMRKFYAMEARGEIPKGTTERWKAHTKSIDKLPERKSSRDKKSKSVKKEANVLLPVPTLRTYVMLSQYLDLVKAAEFTDIHAKGHNQYTDTFSLRTLLDKIRLPQLGNVSGRMPSALAMLRQMLRQLNPGSHRL